MVSLSFSMVLSHWSSVLICNHFPRTPFKSRCSINQYHCNCLEKAPLLSGQSFLYHSDLLLCCGRVTCMCTWKRK